MLSGDPVLPAPLVRRVPGEDAVERELAPPLRVRVEGLAVSDPAVFPLDVRGDDLAAPDPADVAAMVSDLSETAIWALVISDIQNPFFTSIARGVEDIAGRAGYDDLVSCGVEVWCFSAKRWKRSGRVARHAGVCTS